MVNEEAYLFVFIQVYNEETYLFVFIQVYNETTDENKGENDDRDGE